MIAGPVSIITNEFFIIVEQSAGTGDPPKIRYLYSHEIEYEDYFIALKEAEKACEELAWKRGQNKKKAQKIVRRMGRQKFRNTGR